MCCRRLLLISLLALCPTLLCQNSLQLFNEAKGLQESGKNLKAIKKFEEALDAAKSEQNTQVQMDAHLALAELKDNVVNYKEALSHYKEFSELYKMRLLQDTEILKDSVSGLQDKVQESNAEIAKKNSDIQKTEGALDSLTKEQLQAQLSIKDLELANNQKELDLKSSENRRNILLFVLALALLISIFAGRAYILKRRGVKVLRQKNVEITESITYAKRIQEAILPAAGTFENLLKDSFIIYKPKDIVAGDFYWMEQVHGRILLAAADCTGHGVPGAMVSVVCNNALNRAVREFGLTTPAQILNKVRDLVIETFAAGKKDIKDGMDIALLSLDVSNNLVEYAGANNSLFHVCNGKLNVIHADKQPIGKYAVSKDFTNHKIQLNRGDSLYITTDGYMDQFGGKSGKKFKYVPFLELLAKVCEMPMNEQGNFINTVFEKWKGDFEQVDDVCVIGLRL
jgi:serine phosphatase RsbU (regulator of sigma subunit)